LQLRIENFQVGPENLELAKKIVAADPSFAMGVARAYEKLGQKQEAKKTYQKVVDSQWPGIERPLAFPEAKRKVNSL
jgi:Flp pilus assembly protein TadD